VPPLTSTQLAQINQVLRQSGQLAQTLSQTAFDVSEKGPSDFVTSVDLAIDRQLTQHFQEWFPHDGIITEENPASRQQFLQPPDRLWLIDPLDGTDDLIQGRTGYAVMVGLLAGYQPQAGWIYHPSQDQLYYGGPNWGIFSIRGDAESAQAEPTELMLFPPPGPGADFCPIMIGGKDQRMFGEAILAEIPAAQFYLLGSFGLKVMEVIRGRAGLYIYFNRRVKLWDTTGPLALARAAGLVCCDLQGQDLQFSPKGVDTDTLVHEQTIVVGWPAYIEQLLPRLQTAVARVTASLQS
jgi:3'(2'), 5'-bisphosphate nucleotidase